MMRKNWDQIADKEFAALDKKTQQDWSDLRKRVR